MHPAILGACVPPVCVCVCVRVCTRVCALVVEILDISPQNLLTITRIISVHFHTKQRSISDQ